jgi:hypothetical protein
MKTCERATKLYKHIDEKRMDKYCKRDNKILDTLVEPQIPVTYTERFYSEDWRDVCNNSQCGIDVAANSVKYNRNISKYCYPNRKIDSYTGKLASELTDIELESICNKKIVRRIDVPEEIIFNIELAKELLGKGYTRPKYAHLEDFMIPYKNISASTLYLWKLWMDTHGPKNIRQNNNYYLNYTKWIKSDFNNKKDYSGAIEWLLKGGNQAYKWVKQF